MIFVKFAVMIKRVIRFTIVVSLLFCGYTLSFGQKPGYAIKFSVDGLKDTTAYLGYYYGESTYIKDTAHVDSKGNFTFQKPTALPQGVYFLVMNRSRLFEIVVGPNQHFALKTNTTDYIKNMVVTNDLDNKLFFENMHFNMERHKEAQPFIKILQDSVASADQKQVARKSFDIVNEKVLAYQQNVIDQHPTTMTARLFKATKQIKVPEPPIRADGTIDSTFQLTWYRQHFFDSFDLGDDALIRLPKPIYAEKLNEYLDRLYAPQADTLLKAINRLASVAKKNQETYKYLVWNTILKYQNPEIMGLDKIFVEMYDTYFASGEMDFWINDKTKASLKEQADRLRKSLVGNIAPNLIMQDITSAPRSMYDIKKDFTILFFFDPDCGHCKTETPKLVKFYDNTKFNVEVYAVSADTSMVKMQDYIKSMNMKWITVNGPRTYVGSYHDLYDAFTTPTLYLLDRKKKIIAKKIPIEKLEEFLTNYSRFNP